MTNALRGFFFLFLLKAEMYQAAAGQSSPEIVSWSLFKGKPPITNEYEENKCITDKVFAGARLCGGLRRAQERNQNCTCVVSTATQLHSSSVEFLFNEFYLFAKFNPNPANVLIRLTPPVSFNRRSQHRWHQIIFEKSKILKERESHLTICSNINMQRRGDHRVSLFWCHSSSWLQGQYRQ